MIFLILSKTFDLKFNHRTMICRTPTVFWFIIVLLSFNIYLNYWRNTEETFGLPILPSRVRIWGQAIESYSSGTEANHFSAFVTQAIEKTLFQKVRLTNARFYSKVQMPSGQKSRQPFFLAVPTILVSRDPASAETSIGHILKPEVSVLARPENETRHSNRSLSVPTSWLKLEEERA